MGFLLLANGTPAAGGWSEKHSNSSPGGNKHRIALCLLAEIVWPKSGHGLVGGIARVRGNPRQSINSFQSKGVTRCGLRRGKPNSVIASGRTLRDENLFEPRCCVMAAIRLFACVASRILVSIPARFPPGNVRQRPNLTRPNLFLAVPQCSNSSSDVQPRLKLTGVSDACDCSALSLWRFLINALLLNGLYRDEHKFPTAHRLCSGPCDPSPCENSRTCRKNLPFLLREYVSPEANHCSNIT